MLGVPESNVDVEAELGETVLRLCKKMRVMINLSRICRLFSSGSVLHAT
jgi:hypothetical protein